MKLTFEIEVKKGDNEAPETMDAMDLENVAAEVETELPLCVWIPSGDDVDYFSLEWKRVRS